MTSSQRFPAFLAYLLSIVGWLYVLIFNRKSQYAIYHVKQSIGIHIYVIIVSLAWMVVGWVLAWIPLFGMLTSIMLFALVIAGYLSAIVLWILGMFRALQGKMTPLPIVGRRSAAIPLEILYH